LFKGKKRQKTKDTTGDFYSTTFCNVLCLYALDLLPKEIFNIESTFLHVLKLPIKLLPKKYSIKIQRLFYVSIKKLQCIYAFKRLKKNLREKN